jgi:hypothetical protein
MRGHLSICIYGGRNTTFANRVLDFEFHMRRMYSRLGWRKRVVVQGFRIEEDLDQNAVLLAEQWGCQRVKPLLWPSARWLLRRPPFQPRAVRFDMELSIAAVPIPPVLPV